ncbi:MAG TPA: long-chain fatty acid--CoA ligase, partial [Gaiellaceae bacterium]|nr:long-chain fatty acid--CoA ligase [Gaiellaceae bacterium]
MTATAARTVAEVWRRAVAEPAPVPPFLVKQGSDWQELGWEEAGRAVDELAAGFLSLGAEKGDRVAILCRTRVEWTLCDFALISIGAVVAPIYATSSTADAVHILADSGSKLLVCENAEGYAKVERARGELRALEAVIAVEEFAGGEFTLESVRARGREHLARDPLAVDEARSRIGEHDLATIVYTSGTTGPPKGCMHTHLNWWTMVESISKVPGVLVPGDRTVLFLPLAHAFARMVQFVGARSGITIAYVPDPTGIVPALGAVRPTIFPAVPRVFETVYRTVQGRFEAAHGPRRRLVNWALGVGREASERRQAGQALGRGLAIQHALADRLVFSKVKGRLGGQMRVVVSGGAPLAPDIARFFHSLDILILEGYGLTECTTAATFNRPDSFRFGTVGQAMPGGEVTVADDGEVLVRSETVFAGYWANESATDAVLVEDGWLRTGDLGALDGDGFLTITGRIKDIIVTSEGKNISPANIENALKASPYVAEALVVGDGRPHLAVLID